MKYLLIILTGCSLLAGAEIRLNNRVVTFFWTGKTAHFFQIPAGKPGSTRTFQFVLPAEKMPQGTEAVNLQVACQFDPKSGEKPAGSVYFRNITLSAR